METAKPVMLIVRPSGRAKDDVEVCRRAGWQAEVLSPIEIETDEASLKRLPEMYARADAVFWVSPAAVETAVPYLNLSDGIKAHIAVGQGSRRALARYAGAGVFAPEDGNDSEAVLRLPVWNSLPEGARVLSVRGHGGRDFLMNALQEKGFRTEVAEVYFRRHKPLNFQNFQTENIAAAYITSTELVQSLFAQLPPQFSRFFKSLLYFTHHPRIAEALKREGVCSVETVPTLEAALSYSSISVSDGMVFPGILNQ
ncbi:uroporphyrinogen-III synthase [Neisseria gonorrhoeae]